MPRLAAIPKYRAALRYPDALRSGSQRVTVPTLVLWGDRDPYLSKQLTKDLDRWVVQLEIEHLPNASHWLQNDAPEKVNQLLIDFLSR